MKQILTILMMLCISLCTNAQVAGGQISRQKSQKSTQKSTPKTTPQTTKRQNHQTTKRQNHQTTNRNSLSCPDGKHPHMIDLGLPSGTKWACCNVGANKPEVYGVYYAWGETQTKSTYDFSTYKHYDGTKDTYRNLGSDIAGTQYDVAHVKWGGSWVMPSEAQLEELKNNCTYTWTTINGVKGGKFTGKNGKSVFLPAAGGSGNYWLSTQCPEDPYEASFLYFGSGYDVGWGYDFRYYGQSVRPVSR